MATNRVMRNISLFIEEKLGLKVNMTKSKVNRPIRFTSDYWDWQVCEFGSVVIDHV